MSDLVEYVPLWRLRAAWHFVLCRLLGRHEWQECGAYKALNPFDPCQGHVCAWCLQHD